MTLGLRPTEPSERADPAAPAVTLTYLRDRTKRGEIRIRTHYLIADDHMDVECTHRVYLGGPFAQTLRDLWDTLFDAACAAQQARAAQRAADSVTLCLELGNLAPGWRLCVRTIAEIVAHELDVAVVGTVDEA